MRVETVETLGASSGSIGSPCTRCGTALAQGDEVVACPRCHALHHARCWAENGGCARKGCRQLAEAVKAAAPSRPSVPRPPSFWRRPAVVAPLVAVAVLAAGTVSFLSRSRPATVQLPTLRLMTWASIDEIERLQGVVDEYNASRASWQVRLDATPYVAYEQKLIVLVAAGDSPDLFALSTERLPVFAEQGAVLDLTERWRQAPQAVVRSVPPERLAALEHGGRVMAMPHPLSSGVLAISSRTRYPDQAWDLLTFLMERLPPPAKEPQALPQSPGGIPFSPWGL